MPASLRVPCIRCGRSVLVAAAAPLPTCARCLPGAETWEVRLDGQRVILDEAGVRGHLAAGTLRGFEHIQDGGRSIQIASHPRFRSAFLAGSPEALPIYQEKPQSARPGFFVAAGILTALCLAAAGWYFAPESTAPELATRPALVAPTPLVPDAPSPPAVVDPAALPPRMATLAAAAGGVEEPLAILLARAWAAWVSGEHDAAVASASRAVVRMPDDVAALSLLAALHTEGGTEPELAMELLSRARARAPDSPAVLRSAAIAAFASGDESEARRLVGTCLGATPTDLGCREMALRIDESLGSTKTADAENLVYAIDALAGDWPELRGLRGRAALVAAHAELKGAEARVNAALADFPTDPLRSARAVLAFRNGATDEDRRLFAAIAAPSHAALIEAAGDAIARGQAADALRWLGGVPEPHTPTALLYEAQARLIAARAGSARPMDALTSARRAAERDPTSAAAAQVVIEAALLADDAATAAQAWNSFSTARGPAADLARAWMSRAAYEVEAGHPREAVLSAEAGIQADPADPNGYLWHATALVLAQNGQGALNTLRAAVLGVDGRHSRRRSYGGALPVSPDIERLRAGLTSLLANDQARASDLTLCLGVIDWLIGDPAASAARIAPIAAAGADPEALILHARLERQAGREATALADIEVASGLRPKEPALQLILAELLVGADRVEEAERALTRVRSGRVPEGELRRVELALAEKKGDVAAAIEARRAAARAAPDDLVARRAWREIR